MKPCPAGLSSAAAFFICKPLIWDSARHLTRLGWHFGEQRLDLSLISTVGARAQGAQQVMLMERTGHGLKLQKASSLLLWTSNL